MKNKSAIPVFSRDEVVSRGLEVSCFESDFSGDVRFHTAHRDEHYILFLQEQGESKVMVDFKEVNIEGCALFCIQPGQVHYGLSAKGSSGWSIAFDASMLNDVFRPFFLNLMAQSVAVPLTTANAEMMKRSMLLLQEALDNRENPGFYDQAIRSFFDGYLSLFASFYVRTEAKAEVKSRFGSITYQFKSLLLTDFKRMKSPAAYAAAVHISPAYLNEAVKQTTGFAVSYWIQQQIILEAKRMLFYTENTVKEIAHALGYDDHTYFIRMFSKSEHIPPLQFRKKYRE